MTLLQITSPFVSSEHCQGMHHFCRKSEQNEVENLESLKQRTTIKPLPVAAPQFVHSGENCLHPLSVALVHFLKYQNFRMCQRQLCTPPPHVHCAQLLNRATMLVNNFTQLCVSLSVKKRKQFHIFSLDIASFRKMYSFSVLHNKLLQTWQLKTTHIYCLTVSFHLVLSLSLFAQAGSVSPCCFSSIYSDPCPLLKKSVDLQ